MWADLPLFPEKGSAHAREVDSLLGYLAAFSGFFVVLIFSLIAWFAVKYRSRPGAQRAPAQPGPGNMALELTWMAVPFLFTLVMFVWGAKLYFASAQAPPDAAEVQVVAKQWMWKLHHAGGRREINELHVPVGRPVKLLMTSEDVIHSFYVPAFRVKQDVLPGRYTTLWFEPIRTGEYHLFCAEYCGTKHSLMTGRVVVMDRADYSAWLDGEAASGGPAAAGEALFRRLGCDACHSRTSGARGPDLAGLFGRQVRLADGSSVIADEAYLREAIVSPAATLTAGYQPLMPGNYRELAGEEGVLELVTFLKSLKPAGESRPAK